MYTLRLLKHAASYQNQITHHANVCIELFYKIARTGISFSVIALASMTLGTIALPTSVQMAQAQTTPITAPIEEDYKNLYQVEVIIFERLESLKEKDPEVWRKDIALNYPQDLIFLKSDQTHTDSFVEEIGATTNIGISATNNVNVVQENAPLDNGDRDNSQLNAETDDENDIDNLFFTHLGTDELQLKEHAAKISNQNKRVLFHEAWRQPMTESSPLPILIQGGDHFGSHTELEGSITLTLSRYLHIHTNLWLSVFEPNFGQKPYYWPPLPRVPSPPQESVLSTGFDETEDPNNLTENLSTPELTLTEKSLNFTFNTETSEDSSLQNINLSASTFNQNPLAPQRIDDDTYPAHGAITGTMAERFDHMPEKYLVKQIITLKQARKMRSQELHYIDHPRIGLLIRIDPYEIDSEEDEQ